MYLPQNKLKDWRVKHQPKTCPLILRKTSDWVVDHCHQSGMVRGVVSRVGNALLGKIENFAYRRCQISQGHLPDVLRGIADYLEQEQLDVLHPVGLTQLTKKFKALTKLMMLKKRAKKNSEKEVMLHRQRSLTVAESWAF